MWPGPQDQERTVPTSLPGGLVVVLRKEIMIGITVISGTQMMAQNEAERKRDTKSVPSVSVIRARPSTTAPWRPVAKRASLLNFRSSCCCAQGARPLTSPDAEQETCGAHCKCERESCWNQIGERELSEIGADAGTPEGERTPAKTYAFPPEYMAEAGPTLATAPVHPGLSDQVAQLARNLGLDHGYSAPAGDFPPQTPSSANAARASLDGKVKSRTRNWARRQRSRRQSTCALGCGR